MEVKIYLMKSHSKMLQRPSKSEYSEIQNNLVVENNLKVFTSADR